MGCNDIMKPWLSFGSSPLFDQFHRGINILALTLIYVAEENQLRDDQDVYNKATAVTPALVKMLKQECPPISKTFNQFECLIRHYLKAGRLLLVHVGGILLKLSA